MDFLPIAFLILFVILGGVIAVVADNLGRKFGKKRLSVFGLRPKHTATLVTFFAGSTISFATILLVTIVSSDIRQWILEGRVAAENARKEKQVVEGDLRKTEAELAGKQDEVNKQAARLTVLQDQIAKLQPRIVRLQTAVHAADVRVRTIEASRRNAQRELALRQTDLRRAKQLLVANEAQLVQVEKDRKNQESLAKVAADQKRETDEQNEKLTQQNQSLTTSIAKLNTDIAGLKTDTKNLQDARDRAKLDLNYAETQLSQFQEQLIQTQHDLEGTQEQLRTARLQSQFFRQFNDQARTEPPIYRMNEEVARIPLSSGASVQEAAHTLDSLLDLARDKAMEKGAKRTAQFPEAGIYEHNDPATGRPVTPEQIKRQIAQDAAGSKTPVLMVASSSLNAFRGEPVSLEVQLFPNPTVYSKGEVIAETRIDGSRDADQIFKDLVDLFNTKVRDRAIADKMIPLLGTQQFGEIGPSQVFKLLTQVKDAGKPVRVQALAATDTRAGDPLDLEFRIRP